VTTSQGPEFVYPFVAAVVGTAFVIAGIVVLIVTAIRRSGASRQPPLQPQQWPGRQWSQPASGPGDQIGTPLLMPAGWSSSNGGVRADLCHHRLSQCRGDHYSGADIRRW
jgi:hypothetical protein